MVDGLSPLEREVLAAWRSGDATAAWSEGGDASAWVRFALSLVLEIGQRVRGHRLAPLSEQVVYKDDGTPSTTVEHDIEKLARERLARFRADAWLVGEETGGTMHPTGTGVALDPIDGTWSFISRTAAHGTSLTVIRDGAPLVGVVLDPSTGELFWATPGQGSRLLQLSMFGENDHGVALPLDSASGGHALVNLQPNRRAAGLVAALYDAWGQSEIRMVRSAGGSPALALADVTKGAYCYLNLWSKAPSAPYDLAGGVLLVREAGGEVVDLDGEPIEAIGHAGPFVAGLDREALERVRSVAATALAVGA
jgi:myo-inositol-1(or 4)-monophosphatase